MPKGQQAAYVKKTTTKKVFLEKQCAFKKTEMKTEIITCSRFSHNNPIILQWSFAAAV